MTVSCAIVEVLRVTSRQFPCWLDFRSVSLALELLKYRSRCTGLLGVWTFPIAQFRIIDSIVLLVGQSLAYLFSGRPIDHSMAWCRYAHSCLSAIALFVLRSCTLTQVTYICMWFSKAGNIVSLCRIVCFRGNQLPNWSHLVSREPEDDINKRLCLNSCYTIVNCCYSVNVFSCPSRKFIACIFN
jgi:hypothetical protein